MKKVLILNGGYSEIPLIEAAKSENYHVIVTGKNKNAPGNCLADEYIPADYSNCQEIYSLAKELEVDAICSGCNDFAYLATAYACEKLGLPGHDSYETSKLIHHKSLFRKLAKEIGIPGPESVICGEDTKLDELDSLKYPLLVKPIDMFGGVGMKKCFNKKQVQQAVSEALLVSREATVVVEEFLQGTNHGFTTIIKDKKVWFYMVDNEVHEHNEYAVSATLTPSDVPQQAVDELVEYTNRIAKKLSLLDGLVHIQFILQDDKTPIILEVCRRSPGDLYIEFVKRATGVDYPSLIVRGEMGLPLGDLNKKKDNNYCLRQVVICTKKGRLMDVSLGDGIKKYIRHSELHFQKGREIQEGEEYKCGVLFLEFDNKDEMESVVSKISEQIQFALE